jgi:hypothetical protein
MIHTFYLTLFLDEAEIKQKQAMHDNAVAELKAWKEKRKSEIADRKKKNR